MIHLKEFPDEMVFFPSGKYLLLHPTDINPCSYSVATLHGYGLRDADKSVVESLQLYF